MSECNSILHGKERKKLKKKKNSVKISKRVGACLNTLVRRFTRAMIAYTQPINTIEIINEREGEWETKREGRRAEKICECELKTKILEGILANRTSFLTSVAAGPVRRYTELR